MAELASVHAAIVGEEPPPGAHRQPREFASYAVARYHAINIGLVDEHARQAVTAWKTADALARGAEMRLAQAWEDYFAHRSEPPSRELVGEVSRLRVAANEKLTVAMRTMRERSSNPDRPWAR